MHGDRSNFRRSMNEANERDPYNNNCYGTLVDRPYVEVKLPVLDVHRLQRARHPRLRGRQRREGAAGRPGAGPVAGSGRHGGAARLQLRRAGDSGVHPRELHRLHGLRDRVPRHGDPRQGDRRAGPRGEAGGDRRTRPTGQMFEAQWSKTRKYYDGPQEEGPADGGRFAIIIDPSKCKGCAECVTVCDDNALKMIPKTEPVMDRIRKSHRLFKQVGPTDDRYINDNLLDRHDAQGADARLRRRGRLVRRLRRGDGAADDVRGDRREVRRPVGHRRRHRLQHGLHLDVSVQSVPGAVDQFAVRKRAGRRDGRPRAVGPDGLAGQAAVVHRRRRGVVRHRLPVAVADVRLRHADQVLRARYAGVLEHRRPGLDEHASPARTRR